MSTPTDKNLALELVRVTEAAALAASRWIGLGQKNDADGAAVEAMPDSVPAQVNLAGLLYGRGDPAGAAKVLAAAAEKHPDEATLQQQLAIAAYKAKDYDTAWKAVAAARRLNAALPQALLSDLQRDSGRTQ